MKKTKEIIAELDEAFRIPVESILKDIELAFTHALISIDTSTKAEATGIMIGLTKSFFHLGLQKDEIDMVLREMKFHVANKILKEVDFEEWKKQASKTAKHIN